MPENNKAMKMQRIKSFEVAIVNCFKTWTCKQGNLRFCCGNREV